MDENPWVRPQKLLASFCGKLCEAKSRAKRVPRQCGFLRSKNQIASSIPTGQEGEIEKGKVGGEYDETSGSMEVDTDGNVKVNVDYKRNGVRVGGWIDSNGNAGISIGVSKSY